MRRKAKDGANFIIVIDDDQVIRLSCRKILVKEGYEVETFQDGIVGMERIKERKPDLLVVDLKMPRISGLEVISRVHAIDPDICIVVITGYATIGTAVDAMKAGAYDFLPKPFTPDELRIIVRRGLERRMLRKKTAELKKEKELLQRQFVTFVSHQLKSPLVAVKQYLEVLKYLDDSPDKKKLQDEWINRSLVRVSELLDLVGDWLTLSKIESGRLAECSGEVSLPDVFNELKETFQQECKRKDVQIILQIPRNISSISGNKDCVRTLFNNLLHNAIKYNKPAGKITVNAAEEDEAVKVKIIDTGIGIPEDKLELIFEDFYRVKDEKTKHIPGTGLGLPICKKVVDELGGKIEVKSRVDEGTEFTVILPKKAR